MSVPIWEREELIERAARVQWELATGTGWDEEPDPVIRATALSDARAVLAAVGPDIAAAVRAEYDARYGAGNTEHLVNFTEDGWTIQHPLAEREHHDLFDCAWNTILHDLDGPPPEGLGVYEATFDSDDVPVYRRVQEGEG